MTSTVAVVGLGYVGLPLAIAFGKIGRTIGYDLSVKKIKSYQQGVDPSGEVSQHEFQEAAQLEFTNNANALEFADYIIIAVPTPVNHAHQPDFEPLKNATQIVAQHMRKGALVIYESTVYPGATEEVCIPLLEKHVNNKWKEDFNVGYSPERINPGDKHHPITKIVKVVSGDTPETLERVAELYSQIIEAGVYKASSIKVAEAAKIIENTQRDLNIALMNELAILFNKLNIDTLDVLHAAGTKWNFMPFRPGIVGGHCIGVDPYYLTYKAETIGYYPQVILSGRRINDGMGKFIAEQTIKQMIQAGISIKDAVVNVLGITFKENCTDPRNTRVVDIIHELKSYGVQVFVHDPLADAEEVKEEYNVNMTPWNPLPQADALIVAVAHMQYLHMPFDDLIAKLKPAGVFIDVKSIFDRQTIKSKGYHLWRL